MIKEAAIITFAAYSICIHPDAIPATQQVAMEVSVPIICSTPSSIQELVEAYGEKPLLQSHGVRVYKGKTLENITTVYLNSETKTYSIVEQFAEDTSCLISNGGDMAPAVLPAKFSI